jgi:cobalt-precorrin 5A hydrolase
MGGDQAVIVAGIGCRKGCPAADILALVHEAGARTGRTVDALATPSFKLDEPGLHAAAVQLGLRLLAVGDAELAAAQPACVTRPLHADLSVAEGSALAAAGSGARLVLPRIAGKRATCALAEGPG